MHLSLGQIPTIVVSSAGLARDVLKTHDHVFCDRPRLVSAQYLSFGWSDVTFSPYGKYWRNARRICVTELLSGRAVAGFGSVRGEETARLVEAVKGRVGTQVDLSELLFALANDVVCRAAFGRRFEGGGGGLVDVLTETQELFAGFCLGDFFPRWRWLDVMTGYRKRLERNLSDLRRVCDEIIQEHLMKNKENGGDEGEDFVDVLLRVQRQEDLEVPITDDNLKALVMDMFVAGTDTTSSTLEWVMTELARHPLAMKMVQEEVRRVASKGGGGKGGGGVEERHLQELHYMKAAIKEAMRIHPPVPLLVPRESMESCKLDGHYIPARTRVLINTYRIGRDPESWDDPLEFRPERFLNTDIDFKGQDFRFLPFGGGRRGCPGFSFGLATVEFALARLLYHFDWELPPGVESDTMDMSETFGLATRKKTPLVLVPKLNKDYPIRGQIFDQ